MGGMQSRNFNFHCLQEKNIPAAVVSLIRLRLQQKQNASLSLFKKLKF